MSSFFIGTAGWSIPRTAAGFFASSGAVLERYASRLTAVEINSSFYRDHGAKTYEKWAAMTPPDFRFAVKLSRAYTHSTEWEVTDLLHTLDGVMHLGSKLGVLLVQLAPRHQFEYETDHRLFASVRRVYEGPIMVEPRHKTWAGAAAHELMHDLRIGKVEADPERCVDPKPGYPGPIRYHRLHGSPEIYASDYAFPALQKLGDTVRADQAQGQEPWVIFDNTKFGRATHNALELVDILNEPSLQSAGDTR